MEWSSGYKRLVSRSSSKSLTPAQGSAIAEAPGSGRTRGNVYRRGQLSIRVPDIVTKDKVEQTIAAHLDCSFIEALSTNIESRSRSKFRKRPQLDCSLSLVARQFHTRDRLSKVIIRSTDMEAGTDIAEVLIDIHSHVQPATRTTENVL